MEKIKLTKEGKKRFLLELDYLLKLQSKTVELISKQTDISDNSEHRSEVENQSLYLHRIYYLRDILKRGEVIEKDSHRGRIGFGSKVKVFKKNHNRSRERIYIIVDEPEVDPFKGYISYKSPVAKSILGHKVGDVVKMNNGTVVEIIDVS